MNNLMNILVKLIEEEKIIQNIEKYYPSDLYESEMIISQTFQRWLVRL